MDYLNLLDRFCTLYRLRLDAIKRAEVNGTMEILESEEFRLMREDERRCVRELLRGHPTTFFRRVRHELQSELAGKS